MNMSQFPYSLHIILIKRDIIKRDVTCDYGWRNKILETITYSPKPPDILLAIPDVYKNANRLASWL